MGARLRASAHGTCTEQFATPHPLHKSCPFRVGTLCPHGPTKPRNISRRSTRHLHASEPRRVSMTAIDLLHTCTTVSRSKVVACGLLWSTQSARTHCQSRGNHAAPASGPSEPLDLGREDTPSTSWLKGRFPANAAHRLSERSVCAAKHAQQSIYTESEEPPTSAVPALAAAHSSSSSVRRFVAGSCLESRRRITVLRDHVAMNCAHVRHTPRTRVKKSTAW